MWHKAIFVITAVTLMLLTSVNVVAATGAIADFNTIDVSTEATFTDVLSKRDLSIGPHLAPMDFPHDNPLNITEEEALKYEHKVIPVDKEIWDHLVKTNGLDRERQLIEENTEEYNESLSIINKRVPCGRNNDLEKNPPDPQNWCTPSPVFGDCQLGLWCQADQPGFRNVPSRGWVFNNACDLIGENVPFHWADWQEICGALPYVTLFFAHRDRWPHMAYAGKYYSSYTPGWEIYYPGIPEGGEYPASYYYRRTFDCSMKKKDERQIGTDI
ncbi:hypothetical protein CORC01_05882 [Colletotrichum orchidophilum]|uniref:Uncharacterized protein n=1 Tax=Colletotrichum orchidophilum TaxID=1209926 RepID=A0A1G4BBP7_9PEZI|nr:uncharacterized protein CORC01_05882 [Colletotrichum orchidophilum]OHE98793.1 hypothetical protein CORC01_05882 [Colletotrichum orchidophilum]